MSVIASAAKMAGTAALKAAYKRFTDQRAQQFFDDVAVLLGARESEQAERLIEERLQHEWAADAVARGFKDVMEAVCTEARLCIAALVAEYLYRCKAPDRRYRRVGAFLCDSTKDDLILANKLCKVLMTMTPGLDPSLGQIWIATEYPTRMHISPGGYSPGAGPATMAVLECGEVLENLVQMLERHGFARAWTKWASELTVDGKKIEVDDRLVFDCGEHTKSVELLAVCLRCCAAIRE